MNHKKVMLDNSQDENSVKEEDEIFLKVLRAESDHKGIDLMGTVAGMYLLGMSLGWKAFRVAHTRKALLHYKEILTTIHLLSSYRDNYGDADLLPQ
ncbi:MAG: hypothetical protein ABI167_03545 [Nitrosospira sp.]